MIERTLSILKPDAIRRGLSGKINSVFEENGLKIVAFSLKIIPMNCPGM